MSSIKLQFVLGNAISSQAIAWFSQGHLSHVDAVLPDGTFLGSRYDVCAGVPSGVHVRPKNYLDGTISNRIVMTVPCTDQQQQIFYTFLYNQIGKPYDSSAIWGFVTGRNWRDPDSWYCSELIAATGEAASIFPPLFLAANKITPVAAALAYSAVGGKVENAL